MHPRLCCISSINMIGFRRQETLPEPAQCKAFGWYLQTGSVKYMLLSLVGIRCQACSVWNTDPAWDLSPACLRCLEALKRRLTFCSWVEEAQRFVPLVVPWMLRDSSGALNDRLPGLKLLNILLSSACSLCPCFLCLFAPSCCDKLPLHCGQHFALRT